MRILDKIETVEERVIEAPLFRPANLIKRGFPERHVETLPEMFGPSKDKCEELRSVISSGDALIILTGKRGPGKTQMATSWATTFKKPRYFKAQRLIKAFRGEFADDREVNAEAELTRQNARHCDYLVIDELIELSWTVYTRSEFTTLIDERYDNRKATVLITNTVGDDEVQAEVGFSAFSRAVETGGIVECDWPSYRKL